MITCIKCGREKVTADYVQTKINAIMARVDAEATRLHEEDKIKGAVVIACNTYRGVLMDLSMKSFVGNLSFTCKCEGMPAPKKKTRPETTWTKCSGRAQHKVYHVAGELPPERCPECAANVTGGAA